MSLLSFSKQRKRNSFILFISTQYSVNQQDLRFFKSFVFESSFFFNYDRLTGDNFEINKQCFLLAFFIFSFLFQGILG